ncbi:MAG TPA: hypothetical protein VEF72_29915 [Mycobacterium sp.]|nr:hypothetical protein [Mycobacterium sp.]
MSAMQIQPTPGRDPFAARRVAVYKNLHKGAWSIRALDGHGAVVGVVGAPGIGNTRMGGERHDGSL